LNTPANWSRKLLQTLPFPLALQTSNFMPAEKAATHIRLVALIQAAAAAAVLVLEP
jgi:hypothetical protein